MTQDNGPWRGQPDPEPAPRAPRHRVVIWLIVLAVIAGGAWLLFQTFPGQVTSAEDRMWAMRGGLLLVLLSAGVLRAGPIRWGEKARHAAIWIAICAVLAVGFTFRDELGEVGGRLKSELSGSYPVAAGDRQLVVAEAEGGGYFVTGRVNGQPVRFLVDTGSTDTVLSPADAQRLGVDPGRLAFTRSAETANGTGYGAPFVAGSLQVGPIALADMPMVVNQAPMTSSLLGMSFLKRLSAFQVRGHRLYLTW
ncbi:retropepsin-like aspartic protease family protein [Phenylobacterium sp.]|jgi:aspartyl protease family protein|uniref:retropepsin-like aspartic protease family protein n=1 Tax=Phenylobacterium sp. TaxID=1871053 RepID=UPI002F3EE5A2